MDGVNEVISKPPPLLNGHTPHLEGSADVENTSLSLAGNEVFTTTNSLNFNSELNSHDSNPLNGLSLEGDISNTGLPELPFPLPDIDPSLLDSEFSVAPTGVYELDTGDDSGGSGFSFDSSVFNDDLVNSAIWSIGPGNSLPNLDTDVPQELQTEFDVVGGESGSNNKSVPPEDTSGKTIPPNVSPDDTNIPPDDRSSQTMPLDGATGSQLIPPDSQTLPTPNIVQIPPNFPIAPHVEVQCDVEYGFEDNFSCPNPFYDSRGVAIDPFFDFARSRALSTITEGFEEEDEASRYERSGSFNPSAFGKGLTTFADANQFARLNSDPKEAHQWTEKNGWVDFHTTLVPASSDWSTEDVGSDPCVTPTEIVLEENSPETIGSPVSDGNQVGVSPETAEDGLIKPVGNSWQPVSNEHDVISGGKSPTTGQPQTSANSSSVIDSHVTSPTSATKFNPSDIESSSNVAAPQATECPTSPDDFDESSEYMKLSDFHVTLVSAASPSVELQGAGVNEEGAEGTSGEGGVETNKSLPSPKSVTVSAEEQQIQGSSSGNASESTEQTHSSASVLNFDSPNSVSSTSGRIETGTAVVAAVTAVPTVVNAITQGRATDHTSVTFEGEVNRDAIPVASSSEEGAQNQPTAKESHSQAQQEASENDQSSSSLDAEDRSRTASDLDRGQRESNLDSSNLDAGLRRNKNPNLSTPPSQRRSHPVTDLPVLTPLSPEHGRELNQQYEFLRRTLSHSQRRYSERRRPRGQDGGGAPTRGSVRPRYANVTISSDPDSRTKQTVGQLRDLLRKSEAQPVQQRSPDGKQEEEGEVWGGEERRGKGV